MTVPSRLSPRPALWDNPQDSITCRPSGAETAWPATRGAQARRPENGYAAAGWAVWRARRTMKSAKRAVGSKPTTASAFPTKFDVAFTS